MNGQKGLPAPRGRAEAPLVPQKGRKGQVAELTLRWCRTRAERGKPRKGELSLSRCRTKGSKRGKPREGELSLSRCRTEGSKRGKPREGELSLSREAE